MFCANCGADIPDGYAFCEKCGAPAGKLFPKRTNGGAAAEKPDKKTAIWIVSEIILIIVVAVAAMIISAANTEKSGGVNSAPKISREDIIGEWDICNDENGLSTRYYFDEYGNMDVFSYLQYNVVGSWKMVGDDIMELSRATAPPMYAKVIFNKDKTRFALVFFDLDYAADDIIFAVDIFDKPRN